jgi:hypothetical protein
MLGKSNGGRDGGGKPINRRADPKALEVASLSLVEWTGLDPS